MIYIIELDLPAPYLYIVIIYFMRKLLVLLFCTFSLSLNAQWGLYNSITFDSGDVLYPIAISIDNIHYPHNLWQIGQPAKTVFTSAYSFPNAIVTDTLNPVRPSDTSVFLLKAPGNIGMPIEEMMFYYQMNIDTTGSYGKIEISGNMGATWLNLADSVPYNFLWYTTPNLNHSTAGWQTLTLFRNLTSAYIPDTLLFRFTFISDTGTSPHDGWMIDNIGIEYWYTSGIAQLNDPHLVSLYPNPSKGNMYLQVNGTISKDGYAVVYDMQGNEVFRTTISATENYLSLPLPSGNYILKYFSPDEYCTKPISIIR